MQNWLLKCSSCKLLNVNYKNFIEVGNLHHLKLIVNLIAVSYLQYQQITFHTNLNLQLKVKQSLTCLSLCV